MSMRPFSDVSVSEHQAFTRAVVGEEAVVAARLITKFLAASGRTGVGVELELAPGKLPEPTRWWHCPLVVFFRPDFFRLRLIKDYISLDPEHLWYFRRVLIISQFFYECARRAVAEKNIMFQLADVGDRGGVSWNWPCPELPTIPDEQFIKYNGYEHLREVAKKSPPWVNREARFYWRGQPTGHYDLTRARKGEVSAIPRAKLCALTANMELFDCKLTNPQQWPELTANCPDLFSEREPIERAYSYRYAIDIDGWGSAWMGLFSKMLFGCTILKVESSRGMREWFYDRFVPWQFYVPVRVDMSDLFEQAGWCVAHPVESERIALNARELADSLTFETEIVSSIHRVLATPDIAIV